MEYDLKLGERLDIIVDDKKCLSKLQEITRNGALILTEPSQGNTLIHVGVGESLNLIYYRASGMYSCTVIVNRHLIVQGMRMIEVEIRSPISKYQRRDFVRFEVMIPVSVVRLAGAEQLQQMSVAETLRLAYDKRFVGIPRPGEFEPESCLTLDISGGGARYSSPQAYEMSSLVECTFHLAENVLVSTDAQIARVDELQNKDGKLVYRMGCRFVNVEERVRRKIIRFIFDEQIKRR